MAGTQDHLDEDPSLAMLESRERIYQLMRNREASIEQLVSQSRTALVDVQKRIEEAKTKQQVKNDEEKAKLVEQLMASVRRRKEIEGQMVEVAMEADELMREVEDLMEGGFQGRERDAIKLLAEKAGDQK